MNNPRELDYETGGPDHRPQGIPGSSEPAGGYRGGDAAMMNNDLLHVYAQEIWHGDAWIVGNTVGLTKLRDSLNQALAYGVGRLDTFATDGEGYSLRILLENSEWGAADPGSAWNRMQLPYIEDYAKDQRPEALCPEDLFSQKREAI